eukprot:gene11289-12470_t
MILGCLVMKEKLSSSQVSQAYCPEILHLMFVSFTTKSGDADVWKKMKVLGLLLCLTALFVVDSSALRFKRSTKTVKLLTAFVGSSVTLTCDVSITDFNLVEWRRNDTTNSVLMKYQQADLIIDRKYQNRVALKDKKNLQISNLNLGDENAYFCKVSNSDSSGLPELGSPIKLVVLEKQQLRESQKLMNLDTPRCGGVPAGLFVAKVVGSTGLLPCNVIGNPFPEIVWTKNDGVLPEGRYAVTNHGLTIKHLMKEDSGYYQVTLKSIAGTTEVVLQLIVKSTASVLPGHYIDAVEGQMQSIPCGKDKAAKDSKLTWKRNGADPTKNSRFTLDTASGSLVINRVNRRDAGSYNCSVMKIIEGEIKFHTYEMYFNVQYPPEIIYHIIEETAIVSENVSLPCVAVGNPSANVTWQWEGKSLKNNSHFIVGPNGSLVIENVTRQDEGVFTCTPFNKWFGEKKTTKLIVLVPPKFLTTQSFVQKARLGSNITFDCSANGVPKPNITWPPVWDPWPAKRVQTYRKEGKQKIINVQLSDHGRYRCVVVSEAGIVTRDFMLFIVAKPYKPVNITAAPIGKNKMQLSWLPHLKGLIVQDFELWYRPIAATDYDWTSLDFRQSGNETAKFPDVVTADKLIHLRGKNNEGFGPFSDAYKILGNGSSMRIIGSPRDEKTPLAPYNVRVNVSATGFLIYWETRVAPKRPECDYFTIEAKHGNESWVVIGERVPKDKRLYVMDKSDVIVGDLYSFRMYGVGEFSSEAAYPSGNLFGMSEQPTSPAVGPSTSSADDRWPFIIIGIIFSVLVLILILSLICFLRATGRLCGSRARHRKNENLLESKAVENGMSNGKSKSSKGVKVSNNKIFYKKNNKIKKAFHFDNCPLKLVEDYEDGEQEKLILDSGAHVIFSESPEKCQCEHRRCMTLPRKPSAGRTKKLKSNGLYKSVSSPNVVTGSNNRGVSSTEHDVTAETTLNDQDDYDLYDSEDNDDFVDSKFPTIDRKFSKMKNSKMIDSYDQFCRSPSEFGSKDLQTPRSNKPKTNDLDFYVSSHDADDGKLRVIDPNDAPSSPVPPTIPEQDDQKTEVKKPDNKDTEKDHSSSGTPERGSKDNVFDDPNDASSENSVAESDQRYFALASSRMRHPPVKPGYPVRTTSHDDDVSDKRLNFEHALTAIKETPSKASLNSMDKHSMRSYELRSSGFESEGKQHSYTSDTESASNSIPPITNPYRFKDIDVMSDISTRSSPGPLRRAGGVFPNDDEPYEFDIPRHRTYGRPIYNSPKKGKLNGTANNEDLFQSIMKMQMQLGVDLADDSWENLSEDTNLSLVYNTQTPLYRDGYASDIPSSFTDRVSSYSEREKARRCAELLQELKRNAPSQTSTLPRMNHSVKRSQSAVADYARGKPILPPYKRSNSACEEETVFHEWLV